MKLIKVRYWSLGSMIEQKLGGRIAEKIGKKAVSLVGGLSLGQLAAYIEQCDLFITNGRGTMRMATALGIPTISLFGPGNYHKFRPLRNNHTVIRHEVSCNLCKQLKNQSLSKQHSHAEDFSGGNVGRPSRN